MADRTRETLGAFLPPESEPTGLDLLTEDKWLAHRQKFICSSEAAAVLNLSRWASQYSVWGHKTGKIDDLWGGESRMMKMGHLLEPTVAKLFVEETGREVTDPGDYWVESKGIMLATPDRFQFPTDIQPNRATGKPARVIGTNRGVLELKCVFRYGTWLEWEKDVPMAYQIQLQHTMYCCGADYGSFEVLALCGGEPAWKALHLPRHEAFISGLVERLEWWWDTYVVKDTPPPVDASEASRKALAAIYPTVETEQVELEGEELEAANKARMAAVVEVAKHEKIRDGATNLIKAAMGTAELGVLPDGSGYSWKQGKKSRIFRRREKCPTTK